MLSEIFPKLMNHLSDGDAQGSEVTRNEKIAAGALLFLYALLLVRLVLAAEATVTVHCVIVLVLFVSGAPWLLLLAIPVGELLSDVGFSERFSDEWSRSKNWIVRALTLAVGCAVFFLVSARVLFFGREALTAKNALSRLILICVLVVIFTRWV